MGSPSFFPPGRLLPGVEMSCPDVLIGNEPSSPAELGDEEQRHLGADGTGQHGGFGSTHPLTLWSRRCWEKSTGCRSRERWRWTLHSGQWAGVLPGLHPPPASLSWLLQPGNPHPSVQNPQTPQSSGAPSCAKLGTASHWGHKILAGSLAREGKGTQRIIDAEGFITVRGEAQGCVEKGQTQGHSPANSRRLNTNIPGQGRALLDVPAKSSPQGQGRGHQEHLASPAPAQVEQS